MKAHFVRFSEAYFIGALFFLWQWMIAFKAQAIGLTPAVRASMGRFDWLVFQANVFIACLPVMLAYMNQTVSKAQSAPIAFSPRMGDQPVERVIHAPPAGPSAAG